MRRGTTPTITFETEINCAEFDKLEITFAQKDEIILNKNMSDCSVEGNKITIKLTEEETLLFDSRKNPVQMQIRAGIGNSRLASEIMYTTAESILKDGCLT